MRITKLHILLFFIVGSVFSLAYYMIHSKQKVAQEALELAEQKERQAQTLPQQGAVESGLEEGVTETRADAIGAEQEPELEGTSESAFKGEEATLLTEEPASLDSTEGTRSPVMYTVKKGDSLWKIAKQKEHFGKGSRWYDVWKANEGVIEDFDIIYPNQTFSIPLDKPEGYPWPKTSEERKEKILGKVPVISKQTEEPKEEIKEPTVEPFELPTPSPTSTPTPSPTN